MSEENTKSAVDAAAGDKDKTEEKVASTQTEPKTRGRTCAYPGCNEVGKKRCGACKRFFYCGQGHQVAHWKDTHKKYCKQPDVLNSVMLTDVEHKGKGYIATADISVG